MHASLYVVHDGGEPSVAVTGPNEWELTISPSLRVVISRAQGLEIARQLTQEAEAEMVASWPICPGCGEPVVPGSELRHHAICEDR